MLSYRFVYNPSILQLASEFCSVALFPWGTIIGIKETKIFLWESLDLYGVIDEICPAIRRATKLYLVFDSINLLFTVARMVVFL